jgi:DNA/RNA-binding domain of Phe-tRNA-synthetase-like protein
VLVYRDDESIYCEHRGRESAVVRSTFEMVQGLKMIEDKAEDRVEEQADSIKQEAQLLRDTSG